MKEKQYDVFISYSSKDTDSAFMLCEALENEGIICWIAPRNIKAGHYATSIVDGVEASKIFILLFSANSNTSTPVLNELEMAMGNNLLIIPVRIENVFPSKAMKFYLMSTQWFDVLRVKSTEDFKKIVATVKINVDKNDGLPTQYLKPKKEKIFSLKKILILFSFSSILIALLNSSKTDINLTNDIQKNYYESNSTPHKKWKKVSLDYSEILVGDWKYYDTTLPLKKCSDKDKATGVCEE